MSNNERLVKACLYVFDKYCALHIREGEVYYGSHNARFLSRDNGEITYSDICSWVEGDVYKNSVWLKKRDDDKAKQILAKYYSRLKEVALKTVERYDNYISSLANDLSGGSLYFADTVEHANNACQKFVEEISMKEAQEE